MFSAGLHWAELPQNMNASRTVIFIRIIGRFLGSWFNSHLIHFYHQTIPKPKPSKNGNEVCDTRVQIQKVTCSKMVFILSTSQSIKYLFSCRLSISSMIRLNSWTSFMFPMDLAVTCQLFCTAASIIAWRMENPRKENKHTNPTVI